jgi:DeoR/GlpR family transcriptional regulator of sugar metabolism
MIRAARISAIESLLRQHGVLSTQQLADALGISTATVRRDLDGLDADGGIERVFGGARLRGEGADAAGTSGAAGSPGTGGVPGTAAASGTAAVAGTAAAPGPTAGVHADGAAALPSAADEPFDEVLTRNAENKRSIARRAADLVSEGETVFIDVGTTTYEFARLLVDHTLTVVTNSLGVVNVLSGAEGIDLIVLGGTYNREYRCTQGPGVSDVLDSLEIDRIVLGCSGISDRGAIRDTDARQASIKRTAARTGGETMLLADSSKFPGIGAYTALSIEGMDRLVTDTEPPQALRDLCEDSSTEVVFP